MKLPFVRRSKLDRALNRIDYLQLQLKRQDLYELHIPMLSMEGDTEVAIVGTEQQVDDIKLKLARKDNHEREIVQLILDLHDKKWSFDSDRFLRVLNIDPTLYEKKFWKGKKNAKAKS